MLVINQILSLLNVIAKRRVIYVSMILGANSFFSADSREYKVIQTCRFDAR